MLPSFEELLQTTSTNMWLIGLPIESGCPVTFRFIFYFVNLSLIQIEEIMFWLSKLEANNFLILTALAPCISRGIVSVCKAFTIYSNRKKIITLLNSLKELYGEVLAEDSKIEELKKTLNFMRLLAKYVFILNHVLTWVYIFQPMVLMGFEWWTRGELKFVLPVDFLFPFGCDTWIPFLAAYIHFSFAAVTAAYVAAVDTLYYVLTTHICINFTVLSHKMANITPDNSDQLVDIIQRHQYLIELSQELECIFSPLLLVNFVASSIEICMLGFNIVAGDLAHLPAFLMFLVSGLVQVFLLCMFGDKLITESERVGHAAYLCDWSNLDRISKRTLLIIRERARRPQQLTAMKFTSISYSSFSKIISTSWTYFTLLNTVYSPPENQ